MMYLLFRYHNILPSQVYAMGYGEYMVTRAFMHYEVEARNKEIDSINSMVGG
jgi:hypothetical protein